MEIVEERYGRRSTLITSQLPVDTGHEVIGEPTFADAILDRLVHDAWAQPHHRPAALDDEARRVSTLFAALDINPVFSDAWERTTGEPGMDIDQESMERVAREQTATERRLRWSLGDGRDPLHG